MKEQTQDTQALEDNSRDRHAVLNDAKLRKEALKDSNKKLNKKLYTKSDCRKRPRAKRQHNTPQNQMLFFTKKTAALCCATVHLITKISIFEHSTPWSELPNRPSHQPPCTFARSECLVSARLSQARGLTKKHGIPRSLKYKSGASPPLHNSEYRKRKQLENELRKFKEQVRA